MSKTNNNSITEFLKNSIMVLVFLVPFVDLIISNTLYFPFITGKGFVARALIIIIALLLRWRLKHPPSTGFIAFVRDDLLKIKIFSKKG